MKKNLSTLSKIALLSFFFCFSINAQDSSALGKELNEKINKIKLYEKDETQANLEIKKLMKESFEQLDSLKSRSAEKKENAIKAIKKIEDKSDLTVNYDSTSVFAYNEKRITENYSTSNRLYEIDAETDKILQFQPKDNTLKKKKGKQLNEKKLKKIAEEFIEKETNIDLSKLTPKHGQKGENFFFRWENPQINRINNFQFIQVGIREDGYIFSFTNSIENLDEVDLNENISRLSLSGTYYYANGGSYYSKFGSSWSTAPYGYCGHWLSTQWCTPWNMDYVTSGYSISNYARWDVIDGLNQFGEIKVFIPSYHATTQNARYKVVGNSGTSYSSINQNLYYDQWKILTEGSINNYWWATTLIELSNNTGESNKEVGFDEIKITY